MSIKTTVNNIEKEIEQIRNNNGKYIDYVYTRIKDVKTEGIVPLNFKSEGGNISDYRIYGNTVDGESVGDKTGNLFDGEFLQGYWVLADGAFTESVKWICTQKMPCKANTDYTFTFGIKSRWYGIVWYDIDGNYIKFADSRIESQPTIFTVTSPANAAFMSIDIAGLQNSTGQVYYDIQPSDVTDFMLVEGSTPLPYEPYGYRVPVTVNENTTNIYLSSPLIKFGDDADYIDYKAQKRHNIDGTEELITLPILPMFNGNNTLSVETEVQPSNVCIKGGYDYKKVFIATRKIKGKVPLNYRNIEDIEGTLKNYRIYGQTADGESVGDLVTSGEHAGEYKVSVTVSNGTDTQTTPIYLPEQIKMVGDEAEYIDFEEQKMHRVRKNLFDKNSYKVSGYVSDNGTIIISGSVEISTFDYIKVTAQKLYSFKAFSSTTPSEYQRTVRVAYYDKNKNYLSRIVKIGAGLEGFSFETPVNCQYIRLSIDKNLFDNMLVKGNLIPIEYEPFIEYTELDAVLPVLPTITGTNTLSVGTEVKPSAVEVKGKLKR